YGDKMYAYFKGSVVFKDNIKCVIDVNDIGYNIVMPKTDIDILNLNDKICVYTYYRHNENESTLYGFLNKATLEFFKKLISVSGVGPRVAIGIISNINVNELANAIATEDTILLKKVPGIGPKMASKIIFELKDKIEKVENINKNKNIDEALVALEVLGYNKKELDNCINNLNIKDESIQDIIKLCLKHLK
ncbi:MAG: Holliday junction branch migration protein RuvA, partial [Clostridia bacterium]